MRQESVARVRRVLQRRGTQRALGLACLSLVTLAVLAFWLFRGAGQADAQMPPADMPPMPVVVQEIKPEKSAIWREFSGRLTPVAYAVVTPQVSGVITEVRFADGQVVKKGDVLFVIDPRPYEAAEKLAKALLSAAQNKAALAQKDVARARDLIASQAISKKTYDERQSDLRIAQSAVQGAQAELDKAQINLDYAFVKAPMDGRTGRVEVTTGNLVQAGPSAPVLTSVVSDSGIYADFEVDEQTYISQIYADARDQKAESEIPVEIVLRGDTPRTLTGRMHTFDNHIDPKSGTIRARAVFANADGALLPGMFVKVRLGNPVARENMILSEKAIGTDQNRKFVYVVDDRNMVAYRQVTLGESFQGAYIVTSGLDTGDKVIVEGIVRLRPGMPVKPMSAQEMEAMMKQPPAGHEEGH